MGLKPLEIVAAQGVHPNTVYKDLLAFEQLGVEAIWQLQEGGAPSRITSDQITKLVQLVEQSSEAVGLPYGRWSLGKLSVYLVTQHVVKSIGRERLRQLLKNDFHFRRVQRKLLSPDPQRPAILARIPGVFRHLPTAGHLLFFDVKPVAVKSYGGRRYTSAKRLVLARNQKTCGRFYLFVSKMPKMDKCIGCFYLAKAPNMLLNFYITSTNGILMFLFGLFLIRIVLIPASRDCLAKSCVNCTSSGSVCPKVVRTTTRWKRSLVTSNS